MSEEPDELTDNTHYIDENFDEDADVNYDKDYDEDYDVDKLGQSVLTKLADDIRISVRTNRVSIRVLVKSDDE